MNSSDHPSYGLECVLSVSAPLNTGLTDCQKEKDQIQHILLSTGNHVVVVAGQMVHVEGTGGKDNVKSQKRDSYALILNSIPSKCIVLSTDPNIYTYSDPLLEYLVTGDDSSLNFVHLSSAFQFSFPFRDFIGLDISFPSDGIAWNFLAWDVRTSRLFMMLNNTQLVHIGGLDLVATKSAIETQDWTALTQLRQSLIINVCQITYPLASSISSAFIFGKCLYALAKSSIQSPKGSHQELIHHMLSNNSTGEFFTIDLGQKKKLFQASGSFIYALALDGRRLEKLEPVTLLTTHRSCRFKYSFRSFSLSLSGGSIFATDSSGITILDLQTLQAVSYIAFKTVAQKFGDIHLNCLSGPYITDSIRSLVDDSADQSVSIRIHRIQTISIEEKMSRLVVDGQFESARLLFEQHPHLEATPSFQKYLREKYTSTESLSNFYLKEFKAISDKQIQRDLAQNVILGKEWEMMEFLQYASTHLDDDRFNAQLKRLQTQLLCLPYDARIFQGFRDSTMSSILANSLALENFDSFTLIWRRHVTEAVHFLPDILPLLTQTQRLSEVSRWLSDYVFPAISSTSALDVIHDWMIASLPIFYQRFGVDECFSFLSTAINSCSRSSSIPETLKSAIRKFKEIRTLKDKYMCIVSPEEFDRLDANAVAFRLLTPGLSQLYLFPQLMELRFKPYCKIHKLSSTKIIYKFCTDIIDSSSRFVASSQGWEDVVIALLEYSGEHKSALAVELIRRATLPLRESVIQFLNDTSTDPLLDCKLDDLEHAYTLLRIKFILKKYSIPDFNLADTSLARKLISFMLSHVDIDDGVLDDCTEVLAAFHQISILDVYAERVQFLLEAGITDRAFNILTTLNERPPESMEHLTSSVALSRFPAFRRCSSKRKSASSIDRQQLVALIINWLFEHLTEASVYDSMSLAEEDTFRWALNNLVVVLNWGDRSTFKSAVESCLSNDQLADYRSEHLLESNLVQALLLSHHLMMKYVIIQSPIRVSCEQGVSIIHQLHPEDYLRFSHLIFREDVQIRLFNTFDLEQSLDFINDCVSMLLPPSVTIFRLWKRVLLNHCLNMSDSTAYQTQCHLAKVTKYLLQLLQDILAMCDQKVMASFLEIYSEISLIDNVYKETENGEYSSLAYNSLASKGQLVIRDQSSSITEPWMSMTGHSRSANHGFVLSTASAMSLCAKALIYNVSDLMCDGKSPAMAAALQGSSLMELAQYLKTNRQDVICLSVVLWHERISEESIVISENSIEYDLYNHLIAQFEGESYLSLAIMHSLSWPQCVGAWKKVSYTANPFQHALIGARLFLSFAKDAEVHECVKRAEAIIWSNLLMGAIKTAQLCPTHSITPSSDLIFNPKSCQLELSTDPFKVSLILSSALLCEWLSIPSFVRLQTILGIRHDSFWEQCLLCLLDDKYENHVLAHTRAKTILRHVSLSDAGASLEWRRSILQMLESVITRTKGTLYHRLEKLLELSKILDPKCKAIASSLHILEILTRLTEIDNLENPISFHEIKANPQFIIDSHVTRRNATEMENLCHLFKLDPDRIYCQLMERGQKAGLPFQDLKAYLHKVQNAHLLLPLLEDIVKNATYGEDLVHLCRAGSFIAEKWNQPDYTTLFHQALLEAEIFTCLDAAGHSQLFDVLFPAKQNGMPKGRMIASVSDDSRLEFISRMLSMESSEFPGSVNVDIPCIKEVYGFLKLELDQDLIRLFKKVVCGPIQASDVMLPSQQIKQEATTRQMLRQIGTAMPDVCAWRDLCLKMAYYKGCGIPSVARIRSLLTILDDCPSLLDSNEPGLQQTNLRAYLGGLFYLLDFEHLGVLVTLDEFEQLEKLPFIKTLWLHRRKELKVCCCMGNIYIDYSLNDSEFWCMLIRQFIDLKQVILAEEFMSRLPDLESSRLQLLWKEIVVAHIHREFPSLLSLLDRLSPTDADLPGLLEKKICSSLGDEESMANFMPIGICALSYFDIEMNVFVRLNIPSTCLVAALSVPFPYPRAKTRLAAFVFKCILERQDYHMIPPAFGKSFLFYVKREGQLESLIRQFHAQGKLELVKTMLEVYYDAADDPKWSGKTADEKLQEFESNDLMRDA